MIDRGFSPVNDDFVNTYTVNEVTGDIRFNIVFFMPEIKRRRQGRPVRIDNRNK